MASGLPDFALTQENTNYARLCCLLVDVGCTVLRDTFDSIHPPANLHVVLSSPSVFSTLQSLRKKVLNPLQWGKLFPAVASSVSSANFDVTLLMVLLRNICGLSPPVSTGSWDKLPPDSDKSTAANIVRIKWYRNHVYGHATKASVDDATFNVLWQKISSAVLALGSGYRAVISRLKTESMDPAADAQYQKLLSDWKKDDDILKEMLGMSTMQSEEFFILGTSCRCKLYYFVSLDIKPTSFCCEEFHCSDGCNNYCCLTTSALLHHASIVFINQTGIFLDCNVNKEGSGRKPLIVVLMLYVRELKY